MIKYAYRYEFDSNGNWVRRETGREVIVSESKTIKTEVTYRAITCY